MDPAEYARMAHAEDAHWWYRGMAKLSQRLLERYPPEGGPLRVLDAGCGTGGTLSHDRTGRGLGFGCDVSDLALNFCRMRGLDRISRASITQLPYPDGSFRLITCFDVLYERAVLDDLIALTELGRVLQVGGLLLIRAPAYNWLRGQHDEVTHTARRYTRTSLGKLLHRAGLVSLHVTYANMYLFPFAAAKRLLERLIPSRGAHSDLEWDPGPFNTPLRVLLELESTVAASTGLPFGLSVVAVARKEMTG